MNAKNSIVSRVELCVGIDIGTTTISAMVYDLENKKQLRAYTIPHSSYLKSGDFSEQSVSVIMDSAENLLYEIIDTYDGIVSIGITGQMHGIVYVDKDGSAVSNLINWQDKRADLVLDNGKSTCELICEITGEHISAGYGIATHYYNMLNALVPNDASGLCTIMDLLAMKICGIKKPITHTSVGASLGLFDLQKNCFKTDKLHLLGIDESILPIITPKSAIIGECRGIPVCVPIGDNQASFLGSISENSDTVLVNAGTGSQISVACDDFTIVDRELELRPLIEGKYLICGSALCGGYAYAMLEKFFRSYMLSATNEEKSQYSIINKLAAKAYEEGEVPLIVDSCFCGKRSNPDLRGSIREIGRENFTPSALALGFLCGMCNELYELYERLPSKKARVVASGGTIKKNEVLRILIANRFGATVQLNNVEEESATGVALFSALAIQKITYNNGFAEYISYNK